MKKAIKISLASLGFLSIIGTSALAATGIVNAPNGLVLRETASKTANPIATLDDKAEVEIIEKDGEWYKVEYNSQEGYLYAEYVNVEEEITENPTDEQTTPNEGENVQAVNNLKVYNMPLITSTVIGTLNTETEISVIKEITNWSYISAGDIQGWVRTYGINNPVQPEVNVEPNEETEGKNPTQEPVPQPVPGPVEPSEPTVSEPENPTVEEPEEETTTSYNPSNSAQTETSSTATKGYIAVDSATVRKDAAKDSEVVTYLIKGTSFAIKAETEEWYKIEYTDIDDTVYKGYIYKPLVTVD